MLLELYLEKLVFPILDEFKTKIHLEFGVEAKGVLVNKKVVQKTLSAQKSFLGTHAYLQYPRKTHRSPTEARFLR